MSKIAFAAMAALLGAPAAPATVFWSNYTVGTEEVSRTENLLPTYHYAPVQSFDEARPVGVTVNIFSQLNWYYVTTEFEIEDTFTADRLVVPVRRGGGFGDQRIGFYFSKFNPATGEFESLGPGIGYGQYSAGNFPANTDLEIEFPLGDNATGGFGGFSYRPVTFTPGIYRLGAGHWAGGSGASSWYLTDIPMTGASGSGEYAYTGGSRGVPIAALGFQPAFALTDGTRQAVEPDPDPAPPVGVPSPAAAGLFGLGLAALGIRRRRAV